MTKRTKAEIDARIPAHITGARREGIIQRMIEAFQFEERIRTDPNIDFDELLVWLEEMVLVWKELFGKEAARKYINTVGISFEQHLHIPPSASRELRTRLTELLAL